MEVIEAVAEVIGLGVIAIFAFLVLLMLGSSIHYKIRTRHLTPRQRYDALYDENAAWNAECARRAAKKA